MSNIENPEGKKYYVPFTPAGIMLAHLEADTEAQAIANLLENADHMPYGSWENFAERGYTVEEFENEI